MEYAKFKYNRSIFKKLMLYNYFSNCNYDNNNYIYDDLVYMMLPVSEKPMIERKRENKREIKREIKRECIKEFKKTYNFKFKIEITRNIIGYGGCDDDAMCPICYLNKFDLKTECGHNFCVKCISTLSQKQSTLINCPLCRKRIDKIYINAYNRFSIKKLIKVYEYHMHCGNNNNANSESNYSIQYSRKKIY